MTSDQATSGSRRAALLSSVGRYIPVVLIVSVLGAVVTAGLVWTRGDLYRSTARLFFTSSAVNVTDVYQATLAGQSRVFTYEVIASDPTLLQRAVSRSGVAGVSAPALGQRLHIDVPPGTIIMDIGVDDADPATAATLANAVSDELIETVTALERPLGGGPPPVTLSVVQQAAPALQAQQRLDPVTIGAGAAVGFLLGCVVAFLLDVVRLRRTARFAEAEAEPPEPRADDEPDLADTVRRGAAVRGSGE